MKVFIIFCILFYDVSSRKIFHNGRDRGGNLGVPGSTELTEKTEDFTRWFGQNLDHFDVGNPDIWQQKYFVNDEYFDQEKRDVAFLMIGGEGPASDAWMTKGEWIEIAKNSNAILFQVEHRFYGESRPTQNLSLENLKYLTSEQALADLAIFVAAMNSEYNLSPNVKWIAFGGSYSGNLAAWVRVKYSHLIHGAVSTSGPLLAKLNFEDYFKTVSDDLRDVSEDCFKSVQTGIAQVEQYLQDKEGQQQITELFTLCDPIADADANDIANFYSSLADNFAGIAQYNKNNRMSTAGTLLGSITLDTVCDIMTNTSENEEIKRLADFNTFMLEAYAEQCLDYTYSNMINEMKDITWDGPSADGWRQWIFQTCNEFGYYQTSDKEPQIFGNKFPLDFSIQQCIDVYGPQFNKTYLDAAIDRTNIIYGGLDIDITNVIFVHGTVDPWHTLGITTTKSKDAPAILINGTAHCANMYPPSDNDPPQLTAARQEISQYVLSWLNI